MIIYDVPTDVALKSISSGGVAPAALSGWRRFFCVSFLLFRGNSMERGAIHFKDSLDNELFIALFQIEYPRRASGLDWAQR